MEKLQAVTGNNIEEKRGISEYGGDNPNVEGGYLVIKWGDCSVVEEEIRHEVVRK